MTTESTVSIITRAHRQENGQFSTEIDTVWAAPDQAKEELTRIKNRMNTTQGENQWRARNPIGQPDDVTVEMLKDGLWECQMFYRIVSKDVH